MSTLRIQARIRAADTLAGTLWLVGPAATDHLGPLLAALSKTVEDSDEGVVFLGPLEKQGQSAGASQAETLPEGKLDR